MMTESFDLFLYLFLSEVESRQENVRKKPENKNQQKQNQAENIHWTGPLSTPSHPYRKKRHHRTCCPHLHPVSETFCFWQITEKKRKKSTLVYVHEQMNSWRKKKKTSWWFLFFIHDYHWKIKWKQQCLSPYFSPPFISLEHISSMQPTSIFLHFPRFPFFPEGTLFSCVPEGRH